MIRYMIQEKYRQLFGDSEEYFNLLILYYDKAIVSIILTNLTPMKK